MSVHNLSTEPSDPEGERPLRADARRNRQRILEAALEVFAQQGAEAQIDDVARRADLGVGTIYRHFPTKEALLTELVRQKFTLMADNAREALDQDGEPFTVFADLLRRNAEMLSADAAMQHALSGISPREMESVMPKLEELYRLTEELLERGRSAGTIRSDIRPTDIGMLMCGLSSTMNQWAPGFDWHRHLELIIDLLRA